jgi:hypothetical protein
MKQTALLLLSILVLVSACNNTSTEEDAENTNISQDKNQEKMNNIYELAINQAKEGQYDQFLETRAKFVDVLGKENATLNEGKWQPFFTLGKMKLDEVLIGMTHWNSMQGFGETAGRLMPQEVTKNYFASFNQLAYVLLETVDGEAFDVESIKKEGQVIEFAIRKGTTDDAFGAPRAAFFGSLENYDGYQFAREFKVYQLDENSMPQFQENTQAVIIVWNNAQAFQAAATPVFASEEYQNFSKNLEVSAYFASSPIQ